LGTDFEVKRADDYNKAGNIKGQVIQAIANADLIVADLTGSVVPRPSSPAPRGFLGNVICTPRHKCC
jgi:hypothetical protein